MLVAVGDPEFVNHAVGVWSALLGPALSLETRIVLQGLHVVESLRAVASGQKCFAARMLSVAFPVVEIQVVPVGVGPVAEQTAELGVAVAAGLLEDLLVAEPSPLGLPAILFLTLCDLADAAEA